MEPKVIGLTEGQRYAFWRLFRDWQKSFPTCEQLEHGGTGDLDTLSRKILVWARKVLESQTP